MGPTDFHPSKAIVFILFIAAVVLGWLLAIFIRWRAGGRPGGITFATGAARSRRMSGLDPAVLETFPTMAYADVKAPKAGKGALECAVCLSEYDDEEMIRLLPKCFHAFHMVCIDRWLASHVTCPVCRENLVSDAEAPTAVSTRVPAPAQPAQEASAAPEHLTVDVVDGEEERSPPPEPRWRVLITALFLGIVELFMSWSEAHM